MLPEKYSQSRGRLQRTLFPFILANVLFAAYADLPAPILPATVIEGAGILTNAGQVNLGIVTTSNVTVSLSSADPAFLAVPASVTIPTGQSNVFFNLVIGDNLTADGDHHISVNASADLGVAVTNVTVIDNDPHHIRFSAVPRVVDTNTSFGLTLIAENADGSVQTNFNQRVTCIAEGADGPLPVEPALSELFLQGQRYMGFRVASPGRGVRIRTQEYAGQSDAFTVTVPTFYPLSQPVADIVWHAASQTLLASVPVNGGIYSNCLVAIDPVSGLVTNAYPIGYDPAQIEMSPGGGFLYVALSNATVLRRFDLNTRVAGLQFKLSPSVEPVRFASDFCVPPGMADSVVVAARDRDYIGNTTAASLWRYTAGVAASLPNFDATGGWQLESLDIGSDVVLFPNLSRGNAATGSILASSGLSANGISYRAGQLFDAQGNFYSAASLALLGTYPGVLDQFYHTSLVEVDPALRRVIYLSGYFNYGASFYKLREYDRDLQQPLFELPVPSTAGSPSRFVRCGSNFLAYVTGNHLLWIVRSDATLPDEPPADLALSVLDVPSVAMVGSNFTFSLSVSNRGPGLATSVRVTNSLPANAEVVQATCSTGAVSLANSAFTWNVPAVPANSNVTLQVTLRFNSAGWQTNTAWALAFEADPVFTNNPVVLPVYVQLPPDSNGVFVINQPTEDLLYDPVRERLVLSVSSNSNPGQVNGLAVFNPHTGITESFSSLGKSPARLTRSEDNQFLYVSLKQNALVRRLLRSTFMSDLEFALGTESWNGVPQPYYAGDLAVVPGHPESLVVWRIRGETSVSSEFGRGIAVYDNGVMRSNVTDSGGNWAVEFDTNSGTLFGYNSGDLRRCLIDSNGVSFFEQFPMFYGAGSDLEFGGGEFFSSAGRAVQTQPFNVKWLFAGAENAALVESDPASGRVFYLALDNGWQLKVYEIASRRQIGSVAITNLTGTPSSLIRWGTNGLAFRTSAGQLYIVRSPLVSSSNGADLALTWMGPVTPTPPGNNVMVTLSLTNNGSVEAKALQVTNTFSLPLNLGSVTATAGTWSTNGGIFVWTLPTLAAGTHAEISYAVTSPISNVVSVVSTVHSAAPDPFPANNTTVGALVFGGALAIDNAVTLQLPANDVVWSASLGRLLLTSKTNYNNWSGTLLSVNPTSLQIQFQAALGFDASRLAASRDDAVLYAGVDSGVARIALPALNVTDRFLVESLDPRGYVFDLDVAPGSNQLVVAGSKSRSNNSTWVGLYENGIQRPNRDSFYSTGLSLEFGDDPTMVFSKDFSAIGFRRYSLTDQGLNLLDTDTGLLPNNTPMELVWGAGRIYSSAGTVIDPLTRIRIGTIAGIPAGAQVCYDAGCDRVFFFCPGGGQAELKAFDGPSLVPIDSRRLSGITGNPSGFVRWGLDGFAATMTSGQLVIFRSSLIATNPPADVSVSLAHQAGPFISGSNLTATIIISNAGPNIATDLNWNNLLPTGAGVSNATASVGSIVIVSNRISGVISSLAVGTSAEVSVTFRPTAPGIVTNQISVVASSIDPVFTNNSSAAMLWIQPPGGLSNTSVLTLAVKDLERDPTRPVLYASFGSSAGAFADSVILIDPIAGSISTPYIVGSNPGRLAASPDGQFLYIALDGAGMVQKRALPGLNLVGSFPVPQNQTVVQMAVCPTNSDMVAIRRSPAGRITLHVGGVQRPAELTAQDLFAFSETSGSLFGCAGSFSNVKLFRLNTAANGLTLLEGQPGKQSSATDLKSSGGLLFYNRGMVVNPDTTRVKAILPVPANSVVEPDVASGRVYYLTPAGSVWTLRAFDIEQAIEVGSLPLPTLASAPRRLIRWGADGLAFYNTNSQVIILRGALVPTNPPVDVVLKQTLNNLTATTNDTIGVTLQLTNLSATATAGVVVTQSFSLQITNVSLAVSSGSAAYNNGMVTWQLGDIAGLSSATLTANFKSRQTGTLTVASAASHSGNDLFWGNNAAVGAINILGSADTNVLQLRLASRDIVYDSVRNVIYASTPASNQLAGNLVMVIDPATGEMKKALAAGSEPNQLALSSDSRFLHVALDGAVTVRRYDLQLSTPDLLFPLGTNDLYFALDLEAQLNEPETIAASLGSYNFANPYPSSVAIYDNGIARANFGGPAGRLAFAPDCLFGTVSPGLGAGIVRMWPTNNGFRTENIAGFSAVPVDLKFSNGRLYSAAGQLMDPYAPALIGSMPASGPLAIDAAAGRAFYLTQQGAAWQLRAFDLASLQPIATQTVANVQGTPGNLIRCGADRLAFRTSANQLFLIHSALVPADSLLPVNLVVGQTAVQDFAAPTETLKFTIGITNLGFRTSSNVVLAIKPPTPANDITVLVPQGTVTNAGANYLCRLGSLPSGQSFQVVLSMTITNTLIYSNFVSVSSSVPDPDLFDNTSLVTIPGVFFQRSDGVRRVSSAAQVLAYDRLGNRLVAGMLNPNRLELLNPESAVVEAVIDLDIPPTHFATSDDGQYLYVGSSSTSLVQRINLPAGAVDFSFQRPGIQPITAMLVIPNQPHALAIACYATNVGFTGILDDGVPRPNHIDTAFRLLAVSDDASALYGYDDSSTGGASPDVFRMTIDSSGLALLDYGPSDTPWGRNEDVAFGGGLLYFGNGNVLNPSNWTEQVGYPQFNFGQLVELNMSAGLAIDHDRTF